MNEFKALNDRKRSSLKNALLVVFGVSLIALGIMLRSPLGVIVGPFLIWAAFFTKYTLVNEDGVTVHYDAKLFTYKEEWPFAQVTNLHKERVKDPHYLVLHLTKGSMSKRLVFEKKDAQRIIRLALERNKKIHFDEAY